MSLPSQNLCHRNNSGQQTFATKLKAMFTKQSLLEPRMSGFNSLSTLSMLLVRKLCKIEIRRPHGDPPTRNIAGRCLPVWMHTTCSSSNQSSSCSRSPCPCCHLATPGAPADERQAETNAFSANTSPIVASQKIRTHSCLLKSGDGIHRFSSRLHSWHFSTSSSSSDRWR